MAMTVVVTRNVSSRIRGFLASSMLEVATGVYTGARLTRAVRDRIWDVVSDWFHDEVDAGIVMLWYESSMPGGQQVRVLGSPPLDLVELDGVVLTRRPLPSEPAEE